MILYHQLEEYCMNENYAAAINSYYYDYLKKLDIEKIIIKNTEDFEISIKKFLFNSISEYSRTFLKKSNEIILDYPTEICKNFFHVLNNFNEIKKISGKEFAHFLILSNFLCLEKKLVTDIFDSYYKNNYQIIKNISEHIGDKSDDSDEYDYYRHERDEYDVFVDNALLNAYNIGSSYIDISDDILIKNGYNSIECHVELFAYYGSISCTTDAIGWIPHMANFLHMTERILPEILLKSSDDIFIYAMNVKTLNDKYVEYVRKYTHRQINFTIEKKLEMIKKYLNNIDNILPDNIKLFLENIDWTIFDPVDQQTLINKIKNCTNVDISKLSFIVEKQIEHKHAKLLNKQRKKQKRLKIVYEESTIFLATGNKLDYVSTDTNNIRYMINNETISIKSRVTNHNNISFEYITGDLTKCTNKITLMLVITQLNENGLEIKKKKLMRKFRTINDLFTSMPIKFDIDIMADFVRYKFILE